MTAHELAVKLNGREYRNEITAEEEAQAKANNLVVVFGYSDDNMEFIGAINDEVGCYNGGEAHLTPKGLLKNDCDNDACPYFKEVKKQFPKVTAIADKDGYSFVYEVTKLPHAFFDVMEEGRKYCRGMVIELPWEMESA
jgi:hypothetical protein